MTPHTAQTHHESVVAGVHLLQGPHTPDVHQAQVLARHRQHPQGAQGTSRRQGRAQQGRDGKLACTVQRQVQCKEAEGSHGQELVRMTGSDNKIPLPLPLPLPFP